MMPQPILTAARDGVLTLTFNRPDRMNALDRAAARALFEALVAVRDDDSVRAVVLTGNGRGFCAGADLAEGEQSYTPNRATVKSPIGEFTQAAMALDQIDKPVIAAVNGAAVGAGLSYALACDRRIAAASARFAAVFVRRGLVPDCGITYYLPRLVGLARATDLLLTGRMIDAPEALAMGLVDEVCPDEELAERAQAYAASLARGASVAVELTRRAVRRSFERGLEDAIAFESWAQRVAQSTDDVKEGVRAFLEKREPRFQGR